MNKNTVYAAALALGAMVALASADAQANYIYGFINITGTNHSADGQFFVEALDDSDIDVGMNQVGFLFTNTGSALSSITQIYFDDNAGLLVGPVADIIEGSGVVFEAGGNPNLPGGNPIYFDATDILSVSPVSQGGVQNNGVNPGESVKLVYDLVSGKDFSMVLNALALGAANPFESLDGQLRIGIHVQGLSCVGQPVGCETSQSYVIPVPAALPIIGAALAGFGVAGWRTRRKAA